MIKRRETTTLTKDIRTALKSTFKQEIIKLPDHLNKLDAKDRLDFLIKFLPYILPKVETVHYSENEPNGIGWNME